MGGKNKIGRILMMLAFAGVAAVLGLAAGKFLPKPVLQEMLWEDILTTAVGLWMLVCVPVSIVRWVTVPAARYGKSLLGPIASLLVGGLSLSLPVLMQGLVDPALLFVGVAALFVASSVIHIIGLRGADELMRRYMADSTVLFSNIMIAAFSLYAVGERLGVIGAISPWGLVGIACILQFSLAMYVYYRLGMNPEAQAEEA
jgi:hypothetical protein